MDKGLIQVYTGDGKGKSTAALGLALRALGHGLSVLLVRFLKSDDPASGEIRILREMKGVKIITAGVGGIQTGDESTLRHSVANAFDELRDCLAHHRFDLVILDEINGALHRNLLSVATILTFLDKRPEGTEIVLTGRNAPREIIAHADLVSRIEAVKHPLQRGISARRGIEF